MLQCVAVSKSVLQHVAVCVAASPYPLTYVCPSTAAAIADPELLQRKKLADMLERKLGKLKGAKHDQRLRMPSETEEDTTKAEGEVGRKQQNADRVFAELMEEDNQNAAAGKKKIDAKAGKETDAKAGKERKNGAAQEERKMKAQEEDKKAEKTKLEVCRVLEYRRWNIGDGI